MFRKGFESYTVLTKQRNIEELNSGTDHYATN